MKKITFLSIAIIVIAMSCTKEVKTPFKKNPELIMRKRGRNPSLPPTPY